MLLAVGAGVAYIQTRTPSYKATAQVLVTPVSSSDPSFTGLPVVSDSETDPTRNLQTAASILESRPAAVAAARSLGAGWTPARVAAAVAVLPQGESDIVSITGTSTNAAQAAAIANKYARASLSTHLASLSTIASRLITQLESQLHSLPATNAAEAQAITQELDSLRAITGGHDPNFSLLQSASIGAATSSSRALILILAVLAGAVVGVGAATLLEHLNRQVRDEDEMLAIYPLPVLARIPEIPREAAAARSFDQLPWQLREAYRTLHVQLPKSKSARTIMFTSPSMADGKTSSAINLAHMLSAANFRVALIDFDLRKPEVGNRLGYYINIMTFFKSGKPFGATFDEARTDDELQVIGAEPQVDVTPLLEAVSRRLPDMLRDLKQRADYIIIDTAPLGQVSDALRIAPLVDDVILVTRVGNTSRTELQTTRELLDRVGNPPTGMVILQEVVVAAGYGYAASPPPVAFVSEERPHSPAGVRERDPHPFAAKGDGQAAQVSRARRRDS